MQLTVTARPGCQAVSREGELVERAAEVPPRILLHLGGHRQVGVARGGSQAGIFHENLKPQPHLKIYAGRFISHTHIRTRKI